MKPTHPVELLACAIATQEGFFHPGSTPAVLHNPGDLRFSGQLNALRPHGMTAGSPIAEFMGDATGHAALYRQLWLQVAQGQTVAQIIAQWAPVVENNTSLYLQDVLMWTGLPRDIPVLKLLPALINLAKNEDTKT